MTAGDQGLLWSQPAISIDIRNYVRCWIAGSDHDARPSTTCRLWGIMGTLDWLAPPMLCRTPALPTIFAGQRANGVSARCRGQGQDRTVDLPLFRRLCESRQVHHSPPDRAIQLARAPRRPGLSPGA